MKATGAELKEFYDEWPCGPEWYLDDGPIEFEDEHGYALDLTTKYDLGEFGELCWQGDEHVVPHDLMNLCRGETVMSLERYFRAWKKGKTHVTFVVTVSKDLVETFEGFCRSRSIRIAR